jgi:hypothetical protein
VSTTTAVSAGAHEDGDEDEDEGEDGRNRRAMARAIGNGIGGLFATGVPPGRGAQTRVLRLLFSSRRAAGAHGRRQTVNSFDGGGVQ